MEREVPGIAASLRALVEKTRALPLVIDEMQVELSSLVLAPWRDGARPSSIVELRGGSEQGFGEHVGWTRAAHEAFRDSASKLPLDAGSVGEWSERLQPLPPYDRAALEAAAIDLALKQQRTNLFRLGGLGAASVRYVRSFASAAEALEACTPAGRVGLKVDFQAGAEATLRSLTASARVVVLDFKQQGSAEDVAAALRAVPDAILEDPPEWPASQAAVSVDMPLLATAVLDSLPRRPAFANVKAPRMGGVLEALACLARCHELGIPCYIGGMFEVAVGRLQSRVLASLACAEGPNDIAPLVGPPSPAPRLAVDLAVSGFAALEE